LCHFRLGFVEQFGIFAIALADHQWDAQSRWVLGHIGVN
jgi:hypothetical protein